MTTYERIIEELKEMKRIGMKVPASAIENVEIFIDEDELDYMSVSEAADMAIMLASME